MLSGTLLGYSDRCSHKTSLNSVWYTSGSPKLNPHLALGRRYVDLESTGSVPGAGDIGPVFRDLTVLDKAVEGF